MTLIAALGLLVTGALVGWLWQRSRESARARVLPPEGSAPPVLPAAPATDVDGEAARAELRALADAVRGARASLAAAEPEGAALQSALALVVTRVDALSTTRARARVDAARAAARDQQRRCEELAAGAERVIADVARASARLAAHHRAVVDARAAVVDADHEDPRLTSSRDALEKLGGLTRELARSADVLVAHVDKGYAAVTHTLDAVQEIRAQVREVGAHVGALTMSIDEVNGIVEGIRDIADQTRLLGLNASILAAQAGDGGRGFGIVAEQVKELAQQTLAFTSRIGGRIRGVEAQGKDAQHAMASTLASVDSALPLAGGSADGMRDARQLARSVSKTAEGMAHVVDGAPPPEAASAERSKSILASMWLLEDTAREAVGLVSGAAPKDGLRPLLDATRASTLAVDASLAPQDDDDEALRALRSACDGLLLRLEALRERQGAAKALLPALDEGPARGLPGRGGPADDAAG